MRPRLTLTLLTLFAACGPSVPANGPPPPLPAAEPGGLTVCDSGSFSVVSGGRTVGREVFKVDCREPAEIAVSAHSTLALRSVSADVQVAMALDTMLRPARVIVTGTAGSAPVADTLVWQGDTARLHRGGREQALATVPGASFVGANFHTGLWLALARYDPARGGVQGIDVFPRSTLIVEPEAVAVDPDVPPGRASVGHDGLRAWRLRLDGRTAVAWVDRRGRVVALVYPADGVEAIREETEFAGAVASVRAATARGLAGPPGLVPDTAAVPGARAEEVAVRVGGISLAGTLLVPGSAEPSPAVVLISGSGPQDRDGRLALAGLEGYRPFRQIAHELAGRGVAVLRLDDRGVGGSGADPGGPAPTTRTVAADVQAAVAALRRRRDIDPHRIGLLGHSEGALVAMMVAAADPELAGIALLAAPAVRGDSLLRLQLEEQLAGSPGMPAASKDSARSAQQRLFESLRGDAMPDPATAWLRTYVGLEPAAFAAGVRSPVLIVHGARDKQVPPYQASALARLFRGRGGADVTVMVLDGLNHLLLPAPTGSVAEYAELPVQELGGDVLAVLGEWFGERLGTGARSDPRPVPDDQSKPPH